MADFTNVGSRNNQGWIIGGIVVVLILLFIVFASGPAPTTVDGSLQSDAAPAAASAPVADPEPAAAPTPAASE